VTSAHLFSLDWADPLSLPKTDSSVSMVKSAKSRMPNDISEPRDRTKVGRVLLKRNLSSHFVIITGIFRKNSAKMD